MEGSGLKPPCFLGESGRERGGEEGRWAQEGEGLAGTVRQSEQIEGLSRNIEDWQILIVQGTPRCHLHPGHFYKHAALLVIGFWCKS